MKQKRSKTTEQYFPTAPKLEIHMKANPRLSDEEKLIINPTRDVEDGHDVLRTLEDQGRGVKAFRPNRLEL